MDRDEEIRKIAYRIWEREGRPAGREKIHWSLAEKELVSSREPAEKPAKTRRSTGARRTSRAAGRSGSTSRVRSFTAD